TFRKPPPRVDHDVAHRVARIVEVALIDLADVPIGSPDREPVEMLHAPEHRILLCGVLLSPTAALASGARSAAGWLDPRPATRAIAPRRLTSALKSVFTDHLRTPRRA